MQTNIKRPPIWLSAVVIFIILPMCFPFLYIAQYGLSSNASQISQLLFNAQTARLLLNTLLLCFIVTSTAILLALICAFLLERCQIRYKNLLTALISLPLCIPSIVSSFTWFSVDTVLFSGLFGACFVMTLVSFPLAFLPISATLKRLDSAWEEVSYSLNRSRWYTFIHVILPQLRPAIGNAILLIALHLLIEFGAVAILGYKTFSVAIFNEFEAYYNTQEAVLLCLVLVLLCFVIVGFELKLRGNEQIVRVGKGLISPPAPISLGKFEWLAIGFILSIFVLGILVPVVILIQWIWEGSAIHSEYFQWSDYFSVLFSTLWLTLSAALITLIIAFPLVWISIRYRSPFTQYIERLPFILHAIPAVVIGFAIAKYSLLYFPSIYQTHYVLFPAYLMLYLPLAQTALRSSIEQIPTGIEWISDSLGKTRWRLFSRVILPLVSPGLIAGFSLCFLQMSKELTVTLILSPRQLSTLSIELWHAEEGLQYSIVAVYGLSLIVFSGIPVFLLKRYLAK
ncbi:ABC transporter permease [Lonepinella sp. BR2930]|uniref:ABC transporter permease n=1 Tax=Lonepinella sp. BR2930 TaxID=3434554 RepID=UPI003F6DEC0D